MRVNWASYIGSLSADRVQSFRSWIPACLQWLYWVCQRAHLCYHTERPTAPSTQREEHVCVLTPVSRDMYPIWQDSPELLDVVDPESQSVGERRVAATSNPSASGTNSLRCSFNHFNFVIICELIQWTETLSGSKCYHVTSRSSTSVWGEAPRELDLRNIVVCPNCQTVRCGRTAPVIMPRVLDYKRNGMFPGKQHSRLDIRDLLCLDIVAGYAALITCTIERRFVVRKRAA